MPKIQGGDVEVRDERSLSTYDRPHNSPIAFAGHGEVADDHMALTGSAVPAAIAQLMKESETNTKQPYYFQSLTSAQLTNDIINELSRGFRFIFNNDFPEYAVCQPCGRTMSAAAAFGLPSKERMPLTILDTLRKMPDCSSCGNAMELFHDPKTTFNNLQKKLAHDAYVFLLRSMQEGSIEGFTFGYEASLLEIFKNEWEFRFAYTREPDKRFVRSYDQFLASVVPIISKELTEQLGEEVKITPDSRVFCWNCGAIYPKLRSSGLAPKAIQTFFASLPPDKIGTLGVVGETLRYTEEGGIRTPSKPYQLLTQGGFEAIEGVLEDPQVLLVSTLGKLIRRFALPPDMFKNGTTQ